jgi:hypothetical protein
MALRSIWVKVSSLSRIHTQDTPRSVGLLWTSDQPDAVISTWQHTSLTRGMVGIEPTIPASERPQTHDLDSPATGINSLKSYTA